MRTKTRNILSLHRMRATALAVAIGLGAAPQATSGTIEGPDIAGTWNGIYYCNQGRTAVTLTFAADGKGSWVGQFAFYAPEDNPLVPDGIFGVTALHDKASGEIVVDPRLWVKRPFGYVTVALKGRLSEDEQVFSGEVDGPNCTNFLVRRFVS